MQVCLLPQADAVGKVSRNALCLARKAMAGAESVSKPRRWRRRSVAEHAAITFAEAMPIVFKRRRWHPWIAETRMPISIGRPASRDISTRRFNPIVEAALCNFCVAGRWRSIDHGLRMRATSQCEGQRQNSKCKRFAHKGTPSVEGLTTTILNAEREAACRFNKTNRATLNHSNPDSKKVLHFFAKPKLIRSHVLSSRS
jgi:hypothetical protein